MEESNKKRNPLPKWSELCPDLLRCVFDRLSVINLNIAKSVCSSWNTVWKSVKRPNKVPWLILFPGEEEERNTCVLFVPDVLDKVYKTRDLGVGLRLTSCLATHGSWLLMFDNFGYLYILNPLTLERMNIPHPLSAFPKNLKPDLSYNRGCLWVDDITKDYLVVWSMDGSLVFTKKGDDMWRNVHPSDGLITYRQIVYNHKDNKLYTYDIGKVTVWDFCGDIPRQDGYFVLHYHQVFCHMWERIATTVSGQVLCVRYGYDVGDSECQFRIYKADPLKEEWVEVDSLGDEALILDSGFTVVADDIPGIMRNSIYFSGHKRGCLQNNPDHPFIYDLTSRTVEHLPQLVFSSIHFSHARWFFPDLTL